MDIVERAFFEAKPRHWDDLCQWLRLNAKNINNVDSIILASQAALQDGRIFPDDADELKNVLKKYHRLVEPNH